MKMLIQSFCPLCGKACPWAKLHVHINAEREVIRQATIGVIQTSHPTWVAEDGVCERCWNSYRVVSQVIRFFKEFRNRNIRTGGRALRILSVDTNGNDLDPEQPYPMRMRQKVSVTEGGGR